jgi:hypothetical protein
MTAACLRLGRLLSETRCPTGPARLSWHYRTNLIKLENAASYPGLEIIAKLVPVPKVALAGRRLGYIAIDQVRGFRRTRGCWDGRSGVHDRALASVEAVPE